MLRLVTTEGCRRTFGDDRGLSSYVWLRQRAVVLRLVTTEDCRATFSDDRGLSCYNIVPKMGQFFKPNSPHFGSFDVVIASPL